MKILNLIAWILALIMSILMIGKRNTNPDAIEGWVSSCIWLIVLITKHFAEHKPAIKKNCGNCKYFIHKDERCYSCNDKYNKWEKRDS